MTTPPTPGDADLRVRIAKALAGTELKPPFQHCLAAADAVLALLNVVASEMEQIPGDGTCPQCAAYLTNLAATVQARVGGDACPLCAEYLALKERAESPEAAAAPLRAAHDRPEPTLRERIAAALYEQEIAQPWGTAHPCDIESYGYLADGALSVRDAEVTELRRQAELSAEFELRGTEEIRAAALREAADRYTTLADQNEAYDREHGELDETARIHHGAVRDVAVGLRRMADEARQPAAAPGFTRGFRLHPRHGAPPLPGAEFPDGSVVIIEDLEDRTLAGAASIDDLIRGGYQGATVEWQSGAVPAWEAMYEPGNVSDYVIGYANSAPAAKGAAEAWLRSERGDAPGRLEWVPTPLMTDGEHDHYLELIEHHTELGECATGINVRHRALPEATG